MNLPAASSATRAAPVLACILVTRMALAADDIRELRGPKTALSQWPLVTLAAGGLALAVAAYVVWRRLRRAPPPPVATPLQTALAGLASARALLSTAHAREFCDAASDVIRHYIEAQFGLSAQRRTTEEFLHALSALPASPLTAYQGLLTGFLQHCDVVRFSGTAADVASLEALYQAARTFLIDSSGAGHDQVPAT